MSCENVCASCFAPVACHEHVCWPCMQRERSAVLEDYLREVALEINGGDDNGRP